MTDEEERSWCGAACNAHFAHGKDKHRYSKTDGTFPRDVIWLMEQRKQAFGAGKADGVGASLELCGGALIAAELLGERGMNAAAEVLRSQVRACLEALGETGVVLGKKGG